MVAMRGVDVGELSATIEVLASWQQDEGSVPLHPGDIGWNLRFGTTATAAALRVWSRDEEVLAIGFTDSPGVVRLAVAPDRRDDEELARRMVRDLAEPEWAGSLGGRTIVEARFGGRLRSLLLEEGWNVDERWSPLRRDLAEPVEDRGMRIEVISPERAGIRVDVQRAAFDNSTFTVSRWQAMAAGSPYIRACCLVAYDDDDRAVAAVTVWSSGLGRPGLLEPVGVHRDHRGCGYGAAITIAAARALREMGSSSAAVCTSSSNIAAVATYRSAGFDPLPEVPDLRQPAKQEDP